MDSLKFFPALKLGVTLALILIFSPVFGFTPVLAALWVFLKVPKPGTETCKSFFRLSVTASI